MNIVLAGSSGLVGTALAAALRKRGDSLRILVRRPARFSEEIEWKPELSQLPLSVLQGADAVVNLAGAGVADRRWTGARKELLRSSRVGTTRALVDGLARSGQRARVFVSASAVGYYGDAGDAVLDEGASAGEGFLAGLCQAWEAEAFRAAEHGLRVVVPRIGVVLAREGGALARLIPLYRCCLGGRLGAGAAWMSWITLEDLVSVLLAAIDNPRLEGAVNAVAPHPVRNRDFSSALAAALSRPAPWIVPRFGLRLLLGEMADEMLLASARAVPMKLTAHEHRFAQPRIEEALRSLFSSRAKA